MPRTYLLNTPVLSAYGRWEFAGPLTVAAAREIAAGECISAIGHAATAQFLSTLLGCDVPVNRIAIEMQPGDRALVLRLKTRLPENKVLTAEDMRTLPFELGLLTRTH